MENFTAASTAAFGAPSTLLRAVPRPRIDRTVGAICLAPTTSTLGGTRLSAVELGAAGHPAGRVAAVNVVDVMNAKQGSPPRGEPR